MSLPTAPLTGPPSIDYTQGRVGGTMPDSGLCLQFVRQDFEVPSLYYSAIDAWNACQDRHPGDRNPPAGVPVWFSSPSIYKHIAYHLGGGQIVSTYNDDIRQFSSIASMEANFGPYLGWGGDVNRMDVIPAAVPDPEPTPPEDDVAHMLKHPNGTVAMVGPGAAFQVLHSPTEMDTVRATGQVTGDLITLENPQIWDVAADLARNAGLYVE